MRVHNSLTKKKEPFTPLKEGEVSLYTCGPTVYNYVHIGNLRTYLFEDTLRRALKLDGYKVKHVMNTTDIDDKTIKASKAQFPEDEPHEALKKVTRKYEAAFLKDAEELNIDFSESTIARATEHIEQMHEVISDIPYAYSAEDGVYFDIAAYDEDHTYGLLSEIDLNSHDKRQRIKNQEYDKDNIHDFVLWKKAKEGEPSWEFEFKDQKVTGRPGWHIECSVLSVEYLGQPFDIHTGGVDLVFPHHENEIAQAVAAKDAAFCNYFLHAEHLQVDNAKMSKSLNNFFTLRDIEEKGFHPLSFRLLVLQSHYRTRQNFTWKGLKAAQRLHENLAMTADRIFQPTDTPTRSDTLHTIRKAQEKITSVLTDDLNTPEAIKELNQLCEYVDETPMNEEELTALKGFLAFADDALGLGLTNRADISDEQTDTIAQREKARLEKSFEKADTLREDLEKQGIALRDTHFGVVWGRKLRVGNQRSGVK